MNDFCEGYYFRYFVCDKNGRRRESPEDDTFIAAENQVIRLINAMLRGRPDLLEAVGCLEDGLEICLYKGTSFKDFENDVYFYGRVTFDNGTVMELSTDEILKGAQSDHDVLNVVIHEVTHILDFLDDEKGHLPGWGDDDIKRFNQARDREKIKIKAKTSPMDDYALRNEAEFLAVLVETFFMKPKALKRSNKTLYTMMVDYFELEPDPTDYSPSAPS